VNDFKVKDLLDWHLLNKEQNLFGRRVVFDTIKPIIKQLPDLYKIQQIGVSFHKIPIYKISIGIGKTKILVWSQMHGNESTGTKAIFDLFEFFTHPKENSSIAAQILEECTIVVIPMLNPDGAEVYTRVNAQGIDLNRDILDLKAPESNILTNLVKEFSPHFCFNLHDQRTIFSVGPHKLPATISFLAPSENIERTVTQGRKVTMSVIADMNNSLQKIIPGQVGRYTDEFYPTATGDNFQKAGHHTILIEAGHFQDDYDREKVRQFNFLALLSGLHHISLNPENNNFKSYYEIPDNEKYYLDIIYKNVFLSDINRTVDVGVIFKEVLASNKVVFKPSVAHIKNLSNYNANLIVDKEGQAFKSKEKLKEFIEY